MDEQVVAQNTLREELEQQLDSVEQTGEVIDTPARDRARDEAGRFAKQEKPAEEPQAEQQPEQPAEQPPQPEQPPRLSTWKKEYMPLHEKLAQGVPLTPDEAKKLASYNVQRENEYKTGVSTYKQQAEAAKQITSAVEPYIPILREHGIAPDAWINSLAQTHLALAKGTPQQKVAIFTQLARQFGVPLQLLGDQPLPPAINELMARVDSAQTAAQRMQQWQKQQEEAAMRDHVSRFQQDTKQFPHFQNEAVREQMARLLETGLAHDIPTAYSQAVRLVDEVWSQVQQAQLQPAIKQAAVQRAKAAAVSPRSVTPNGMPSSAGGKDRRSVLAAAFEELDDGRV